MDFLFHAVDGIRDYTVTGVQTCALPIFYCTRPEFRAPEEATKERLMTRECLPPTARLRRSLAERSVGGLRAQQPVLDWLFNRFVDTGGVLREWAQRGYMNEAQCRNVLRANGYDGGIPTSVPVRERRRRLRLRDPRHPGRALAA